VTPLNYDGNGNNLVLENYVQTKSAEDFINNGYHPRIYIQSRGHGIFMDEDNNWCLNTGNAMNIDRWDEEGFPKSTDYTGTGIVYYCSSKDKGDIIDVKQHPKMTPCQRPILTPLKLKKISLSIL